MSDKKLQMRFQQKQIQENAQKKGDIYNGFDLNATIGGGKVRQMFDERRRIVAGIDKSYLLDPIVANTKKPATVPKTITTRVEQKTKVHHVPPLSNRTLSHDINGNPTNDIFDKGLMKPSFNGDSFEPKKLSGVSTRTTTTTTTTNFNRTVPKVNIEAKPLTNGTNLRKPSPAAVHNNPPSSLKSAGSLKSPTKSFKSVTSSASSSASSRKAPSAKSEVQRRDTPSPAFDENAPVPDGLVRCLICKRNFADDRIEKHRVICQKTKSKKRKVFDSTKKRVEGTEAESYVRRQAKVQVTKAPPPPKPVKQGNWRSKHEEFIRTIREAKKVSAYLAKGGDIRDLPPPPPSENPDYIQCPHCSRKFNEAAANRHIPVCQKRMLTQPAAAQKDKKTPVARFVGLKKR